MSSTLMRQNNSKKSLISSILIIIVGSFSNLCFAEEAVVTGDW